MSDKIVTPVVYINSNPNKPVHRPIESDEKLNGSTIQISQDAGNSITIGSDGGIHAVGGGSSEVKISADVGNTLTKGSDQGLYVPPYKPKASTESGNQVVINSDGSIFVPGAKSSGISAVTSVGSTTNTILGSGTAASPMSVSTRIGSYAMNNPLNALWVNSSYTETTGVTNGLVVSGVNTYMYPSLTLAWNSAGGLAGTVTNLVVPDVELRGKTTAVFKVYANIRVALNDSSTPISNYPDSSKGVRVIVKTADIGKAVFVDCVTYPFNNTTTVDGCPTPTGVFHRGGNNLIGTLRFGNVGTVPPTTNAFKGLASIISPIEIYTNDVLNTTGKTINRIYVDFVVEATPVVTMQAATIA